MHESRIVADLITRVESEVDPATTKVVGLTLRVGALSALSPSALREGVESHAARAWGYAPEVKVDRSVELDDPAATGVRLESIHVDG
jgi:Zn finger protein HypA/HybF involved in hydrogenase expression